uniref:Neur_chan_LBD domain-containing protein n=1 Tax=Syphacia muris TaxID=451379 RepID=A0A158R5V8_9BILA
MSTSFSQLSVFIYSKLLLVVIIFGTVDANCGKDTFIMDYLLNKTASGYNRQILPSYPVQVRIELWIQEVTSVSELTQDFEIDLYINEFWEDPALVYSSLIPCNGNLSFDSTMQENIWIPNTCFVNSKNASIHSSPFRNVFFMIFPNGSIWTNWRVKSKGPCKLDLARFPMDFVICFLVVESYNYNAKQVRMKWNHPTPVLLFKEMELPDFVMINYSIHTNQTVILRYAAGLWDELTISFLFQRRNGFYMLQGFIPTLMTVFISWISFYLSPSVINARTMIGVNSLLAMTFQFGSIVNNLPRVNYVKQRTLTLNLSGFLLKLDSKFHITTKIAATEEMSRESRAFPLIIFYIYRTESWIHMQPYQ